MVLPSGIRLRDVAIAVMALHAVQAQAVQFDTPEDWSVRWDNTVRASTKYRLQSADPALSQSFINGFPQAAGQNAGNQNFQKRGIVSERLDLLTEFDAVWRGSFGARFSGAGWYDHKIRGTTDADNDITIGQTPYNEFPQETIRKAGRKAELLDAFVFGGWQLGDESKLTVRLGRHALQYGESLFFGDNGIARAQGPVDVDKLFSSPNAQFKEIIRPVPQLSTMLQLSPDVSVGGYYQFRWESDRLPASGTYFSTSNIPYGSMQSQVAGLPLNGLNAPLVTTILSPGAEVRPKDSGQYGLQLKWRALDTDFGAYYARYHDKNAQLYGGYGPVIPTPNGDFSFGNWYWRFPEGIRTFGASASRSLGDFNFAVEASIRHNMPLRNTDMFYSLATAEPQFAVGKTAHVNFSWLATLGPNFLSQETSFMGELAWHRVLSKNDPAGNLDLSRTRDATAVRMIFSPAYRQVLPGVDLNVPIGLGYTLQGQSAISVWGAKNTGDLSVGLEGTYLSVWQLGLNYVHYIGKAIPFIDYSTGPTLGFPTYTTGQPFADRDYISVSLRRTF